MCFHTRGTPNVFQTQDGSHLEKDENVSYLMKIITYMKLTLDVRKILCNTNKLVEALGCFLE